LFIGLCISLDVDVVELLFHGLQLLYVALVTGFCSCLQDLEPALASVLHTTILVHNSLEKTMAFVLANKLQSHTLRGTHLLYLFEEAFTEDKVRFIFGLLLCCFAPTS
jgi:hypothetical protein